MMDVIVSGRPARLRAGCGRLTPNSAVVLGCGGLDLPMAARQGRKSSFRGGPSQILMRLHSNPIEAVGRMDGMEVQTGPGLRPYWSLGIFGTISQDCIAGLRNCAPLARRIGRSAVGGSRKAWRGHLSPALSPIGNGGGGGGSAASGRVVQAGGRC